MTGPPALRTICSATEPSVVGLRLVDADFLSLFRSLVLARA